MYFLQRPRTETQIPCPGPVGVACAALWLCLPRPPRRQLLSRGEGDEPLDGWLAKERLDRAEPFGKHCIRREAVHCGVAEAAEHAAVSIEKVAARLGQEVPSSRRLHDACRQTFAQISAVRLLRNQVVKSATRGVTCGHSDPTGSLLGLSQAIRGGEHALCVLKCFART